MGSESCSVQSAIIWLSSQVPTVLSACSSIPLARCKGLYNGADRRCYICGAMLRVSLASNRWPQSNKLMMDVALGHQCCSVALEAASHAYIPVVRPSPVQLIHRVGCRLILCNVVYERELKTGVSNHCWIQKRCFVMLSLTLPSIRRLMYI